MTSKKRWGIIGAVVGGVISMAVHHFGFMPDFKSASSSEMLGYQTGSMIAGYLYGGVIGFAAGWVRDLIRRRRLEDN